MAESEDKLVGYDEGARVDRMVNVLLKHHPITPKNAGEWLKFLRTVQTTTEVLMPVAVTSRKRWVDAGRGTE